MAAASPLSIVLRMPSFSLGIMMKSIYYFWEIALYPEIKPIGCGFLRQDIQLN
jgi:hypothetical protein